MNNIQAVISKLDGFSTSWDNSLFMNSSGQMDTSGCCASGTRAEYHPDGKELPLGNAELSELHSVPVQSFLEFAGAN